MCYRAARKRLRGRARRITTDLDPTDDPTCGAQQLAFVNGHYHNWCYLPLLAFVTFDQKVEQCRCAAVPRPGNAPATRGALPVLSRMLEVLRLGFPGARLLVRLDGGFATPAVSDFLDAASGVDYVVAMAENAVLTRASPPRFVYEKVYCARGRRGKTYQEIARPPQARAHELHAVLGQSTPGASTAAYVLMQELRLQAAGTACARAQVTRLRERQAATGRELLPAVAPRIGTSRAIGLSSAVTSVQEITRALAQLAKPDRPHVLHGSTSPGSSAPAPLVVWRRTCPARQRCSPYRRSGDAIQAGMGIDDYKVVLYRQDDAWVAEIPALAGCYALMPSRDEALAELLHVFSLIEDEYRQQGKALPADTTEIVDA